MTVDDAMSEIESHEFAGRVNAASDMGTFLRIAEGEEAVSSIVQELDSESTQARVFRRILELSKTTVDIRYENPGDVALTIYLWLMSRQNHQLAILVAPIVSEAPQCWWAARMAFSLTKLSPLRTNSGLANSKAFMYQIPDISITEILASGEAILPVGSFDVLDERVFVWHYMDAKLDLRDEYSRLWQYKPKKYKPKIPYVYAKTGDDSGAAITT